MLISSVVECRGAERFGILATALEKGPLQSFYERLWKSETKHGHQFVHLLLKESDEVTVFARLEELMKLEAKIVEKLSFRPALH